MPPIPLATVMERKLTRMRSKHAQTREFMEVNALKGIIRDGSGATLYDYFSEFALSRQQVDFTLGTATTNVQAKIREVLRKVEVELKGETMTSVLALVSPEFFDKLISHAKVEQAYNISPRPALSRSGKTSAAASPSPASCSRNTGATVTLSTGATETLIPAGEGIAFPLGTMDTFVTYGAPANLIETVNTLGVPMYARQLARQDGSAIDVKTEASILPVNKRRVWRCACSRATDDCVRRRSGRPVRRSEHGRRRDLPGSPVRALVRRPDRNIEFSDITMHSSTVLFEIRRREVPAPQAGDIIIHDGRQLRRSGRTKPGCRTAGVDDQREARMKLAAAITGDLRKIMAEEVKAAEDAVTAAMRQAADGLKADLRRQVTEAGMGQRLANTWRAELIQGPKKHQTGGLRLHQGPHHHPGL